MSNILVMDISVHFLCAYNVIWVEDGPYTNKYWMGGKYINVKKT